MKQFVCEMCGSNDLVKKDDAYVCQFCGCKYSAEDAKKMIVEIDNSKKLANLYERARKSLDVDDLAHAAEYYKQILDEVPNDWEAYFYSYLGEFTTFTNAQAGSVAAKLANTIPPAYDMAIEAGGTKEEILERIQAITAKTATRLVGIASSGASLLRQYEGGNVLTPTGKVKQNMYNGMRDVAVNTIANCVVAFQPLEQKLVQLLDGANDIDKESLKKCLLLLRKLRYDVANWEFAPYYGGKEKLIKAELIQEYAQGIKELDPDFVIPEPPKKSGCYVATCVYGSYDCPQVWTLRRYRDETLGSTWYGRLFIRFYYAVSPTLVKWFGKTKWFKKLWKSKLDHMVAKLQQEGVEDTPYQDKQWH